MTVDDPLDVTNTYVAANVIARRNPTLTKLVHRLVPGGINNEDWLDIVATTINANDEHRETACAHDSTYTPAEGTEYDASHSPRPASLSAFNRMSTGERAMLRLVATLSDERVRWRVQDITGDHDTAALLDDWTRVVRNQIQIPAWL